MTDKEWINQNKDFLAPCTSITHVPAFTSNRCRIGLYCKEENINYDVRIDTFKKVGCKFCRRKEAKRLYDEGWKKDCTLIHKGKYDYSKTEVGDVLKHSLIFCKECKKEFSQTPASHKSGKGCPICGIKKSSLSSRKNIEFVINKAKSLGFNYNFDNSVYINCKKDIEIVCDKGHTFHQSPDELLNAKHGCYICSKGKQSSRAEEEIYEFLSQFYNCERGWRKHKKELDIYIPGIRTGIEFNGLYWHSEEIKGSKISHLDKIKFFKDRGINVIHIYEDDWKFRRRAVETHLEDCLLMRNRGYKCIESPIFKSIQKERGRTSIQGKCHKSSN